MYDQLSQSRHANPTNLETLKVLVSLFPLSMIAPKGRVFPPRNTDEQLRQLAGLGLTQDSIEHWLDQIYTYGQDSIENYEFLIDVYRRNYKESWGWACKEPGCTRAMELCDEMVEKFPEDIRSRSLRAEFIIWERIMQLLDDDREASREEKRYLEEIGQADRLLPLLFDNQSASFSTQEQSVRTDSQKVARILLKAEKVREGRMAIQKEVKTLAAIAKADAQMAIDMNPDHWKGYWLRSMARYWLDEKIQAQEDFCRAKDLYIPRDPLAGRQDEPTYIQPYYRFEQCVVDKM